MTTRWPFFAAKRKTSSRLLSEVPLTAELTAIDLGRGRVVVRLLLGDLGQAVRHGEQPRVADAEAADEAHVVGPGGHVGGDGDAEAAVLDDARP